MPITSPNGDPCGVRCGDKVEPFPAAALFRSLGDPTRLAILRRLATGEARVGELVEEVGLAQSTVSKHLACLKECGLVDFEPVGRASVFPPVPARPDRPAGRRRDGTAGRRAGRGFVPVLRHRQPHRGGLGGNNPGE